MVSTQYAHISLADDGTPCITGTTTKVIEVAMDRLAHAWDADEIHRQHPHLSLGQIHSTTTTVHYYLCSGRAAHTPRWCPVRAT